jgi:hypothetical protein
MERARFIEHRGARVLEIDLRGVREVEELRRLGGEVALLLRREGGEPVLVLVDLAGVPLGLRALRLLGEMAAANRDYVRARAVHGLPEIALRVVAEFARFSGRPVHAFADREQALEWLVAQR